jgi:hypothetical protein
MRKASEKPLLTLIEAGGVNKMPVVVEPAAARSDTLIEALKAVKAAGYRVIKPRKPKTLQHNKKRVGPTFVAEFADGTVTRMSTFTLLTKLDWDRGMRLSEAAYQSRWRKRQHQPGARAWWEGMSKAQRETYLSTHSIFATDFVIPPAIVAAHFEQDGEVLAHYEQRDLST